MERYSFHVPFVVLGGFMSPMRQKYEITFAVMATDYDDAETQAKGLLAVPVAEGLTIRMVRVIELLDEVDPLIPLEKLDGQAKIGTE